MVESEDLKKQIEALLFSAGRVISSDELAKFVGIKQKNSINEKTLELKEDYEKANSPIMIIEESDGWKMTVREKFLPLVRKINPHTELSKTIMETLAVVAWKSPVLQSTVIKIRTNKAYDHISELEDLGFIIKEKYGRSYMLKITQKFYEYFDLKDKKDIAKLFKDIKDKDFDEQMKVDEFEDAKEIEAILSEGDNEEAEKLDENIPDEEKQVLDEISKMEESGEEDPTLESLGNITEEHSEKNADEAKSEETDFVKEAEEASDSEINENTEEQPSNSGNEEPRE